jgi:RHH-type proline utilization regulon transcriptional repressor/proline dehydrogenase/delta 1-pyrroline-5-carboxylate dehydrogenase
MIIEVDELVAGNPVILKPAETSSLVAKMLFERMLEAGIPSDVVQFLPGRGSEVGAYLVEHSQIAQIAFTGSKEVGLQIIEKAARVQPGQPQVKRVVCEMGGKNAVVVDDDADLDEAAIGVIQSSFGYAGQKCSAASRVIIHQNIYDRFKARLVEACKSLCILPATDPGCGVPPVIDAKSKNRLMTEIELASREHKVLAKFPPFEKGGQGGFFVPVTLLEVQNSKCRLMQTELFGPVLAIAKAKDFEDAIQIANDTEFALTGAVYSRSPKNLEYARQAFKVGNLYLNRSSTGAMVHRQPFGGFKMSGMGTKAGGPDYLMHFVDPRVVTENTLRRGFTPDLE